MTSFARTRCLALAALSVVVAIDVGHAQARFTHKHTIRRSLGDRPLAAGVLVGSRDGGRLYEISRTGPCPDDENVVAVYSPNERRVLDTIDLGIGGNARMFAIAPVTNKAYACVTATFATGIPVPTIPRIAVVDLVEGKVIKTLRVDGSVYGPTAALVTPDGTTVFVAHVGHTALHVIDASKDELASPVVVPRNTQLSALAATPDGTRLYAASRSGKPLVAIDVATRTVVGRVPHSLGRGGHANLAMDPSGTSLYYTVAHRGSRLISVIDVRRESETYHREVATIETRGSNLGRVCASADGSFLLVASHLTNEVLVIDLRDPDSPTYRTQVSTISFERPDEIVDLVIGPLGKTAYVSLTRSGIAVLQRADK